MPKRVPLSLLMSILIASGSLDAYATLYTDHESRSGANIYLVQSVIDSDKTVYITLDPKLKQPGVADFVSANSDDEILIRIGVEKAGTDLYGPFLDTRITLVHELVHAHQAISDPARFRNRNYRNVYALEYEAYDLTAQWAQDIGGHYHHALGYVSAYDLHGSRFDPNSANYKRDISGKAKESALKFK